VLCRPSAKQGSLTARAMSRGASATHSAPAQRRSGRLRLEVAPAAVPEAPVAPGAPAAAPGAPGRAARRRGPHSRWRWPLGARPLA